LTTTFTEGVLSSMQAWAPPGSDFYNYTTALAAMFEPVWTIVSDQGSPDDPANYTAGWSILLDVTRCPTQYLPWMGMFVGIYVAPGTADATARAMITSRMSWSRGTPAGIVATAQQFLTGTQSCVILERQNPSGSDAYAFTLVMRPEECADQAQLEAAVALVKPAGVLPFYVFTDDWTISQFENAFATVAAAEAAFSAVTNLETDTTSVAQVVGPSVPVLVTLPTIN